MTPPTGQTPPQTDESIQDTEQAETMTPAG